MNAPLAAFTPMVMRDYRRVAAISLGMAVITGLKRGILAASIGFLAILGPGCADSSGPTTGAIHFVVVTTGASADSDSDGYQLSIDYGPPLGVPVNTGVLGTTIASIAPGNHMVRLGGLASNCSVIGVNPRPVDVVAAAVSLTVSFTVTCAENTGSIRVSTVTSGAGPSAGGYALYVAGVGKGNVMANGTTTIAGLRTGRPDVMLTGFPANCAVDGSNSRPVEIVFGQTTDVAFAIRCVATASGGVRVTATTTGVAFDPGEYNLEVRRDGNSVPQNVGVPKNGTVTVSGLSGGSYTLALLYMQGNCDVVSPNPQQVTVAAGIETPISITVECATPFQLAFATGTTSKSDIYVANSKGEDVSRLTTESGLETDPAWSPDGRSLAFTSDRNGNRDIYVMNLSTGNSTRATNAAGADHSPTWSSDGAKIAFVSDRDGSPGIWVMNADGTNVSRLTGQGFSDADPAWSPDGTQIAFASTRGGTPGIWVMNADGSNATRITAFNGDSQPAWSPDGKKLAFARGSGQIFTMNADGSGPKVVSQYFESARDPAWSPDGRKIAFVGFEGGFYYRTPYIYLVDSNGLPYAQVGSWTPVSGLSWRPR